MPTGYNTGLGFVGREDKYVSYCWSYFSAQETETQWKAPNFSAVFVCYLFYCVLGESADRKCISYFS